MVSSVPRRGTNIALLHALRHHGYRGRLAVTAHDERDARELEDAGADLVLRPFRDAAGDAVEALRLELDA